MFYLYIIYSSKLDKFYVGYSDDLVDRLIQHNSGLSKYTSKASDWKQVYTESYHTRREAACRERQVKRQKSRKYIEWLIRRQRG